MGNSSFVRKASSSTCEEPGYNSRPVGEENFQIRISDSLLYRLKTGKRLEEKTQERQLEEDNERTQESPRDQPSQAAEPESLPNSYAFQPYISLPGMNMSTGVGSEIEKNDLKETAKFVPRRPRRDNPCKLLEEQSLECVKENGDCREIFIQYEDCLRQNGK